ncbi:LAQU0S12e00716g1_1 [Lachancea quebecensis]|uniref:LAQU0S12e00716g1_1 n=1 Tax=Lachancea quebecensis TaxID=1654605 RepID=A0A0P1KUB6_9SACH|nr:LAQU0S12e00716g1_1 [Lachancea quebecensis]
MAFKSFKCKFYSKGYHSSAQKQTTAFFESSYQYLRRNQGVVSQESHIPSSHNVAVSPNPVVVANVNYNNLEHVLETEAAEENARRTEGELSGSEQKTSKNDRRSSLSGAGTSGQARDRYRAFNADSIPHYSNNRHLVINERLSKSYFSTTAAESSNTPCQEAHLATPSATAEPTTVSDAHALNSVSANSQVSPWEPDTEEGLNPETFMQTQVAHIKHCFSVGDYNKINALYQALLRNDIIPPVEIYALVIESVCKRDLDNDNVDNRMFQLLNCYQDLINNRLKPTEEIYSLVIGSLLRGSIMAYDSGNGNGSDFYKIAVDLFRASNAHKSHEFPKELLDCSLLAMNLYPGYVELDYVIEVLNNSKLYARDTFYYVSMMSYAKHLNDNAALKKLYDEFRSACITDVNLQNHQYEVYSTMLSGLVETGDMALAIKLLDKVLTDAKQKVGLASNISMVLSNFLISVSKMDCQKAYQLWLEFKKLQWIPEFSYDFYLMLLSNSSGDWQLASKIYDYMLPMKRESSSPPASLSERLLKPQGTESMLSSFLDYALQLHDTEVIMKVLEESIIKRFGFEIGVYPYVFQFLKNIRCPDDYLLRFINFHGQLLTKGSERFEFLNGLIDSFQSQVILARVTEMKFFADYCRSFNVAESRVINHSGIIACFQSLWGSPQTIERYSYNIELHGIMVCKLHDLEGYYAVMENEYLLQFKDRLTERFEKLMINYKRLNLDPNMISGAPVQAAKMIGMSEELINYFVHPGDWDKSYPLCLGSMLRNSLNTGLKAYERLKDEGYCFDYDTYRELIKQKVNNNEIITKALELCPDEEEEKYLSNCLAVKTYSKELEEKVLKHPLFREKILPHLKDVFYVRLAKHTSNFPFFMEQIGFPQRFRSIADQVEHKEIVGYIYERLFKDKKYNEILALNNVCPVLDVELLLKSCIRAGEFAQYKAVFNKFKDSLGDASLNVQAEYLITNKKIDEAVKLIRGSSQRTEHKTNDLLSFALFLKSFSEPVMNFDLIENTLQLANILSSQDAFASMVALYQTLMHDSASMHGTSINQATSCEIVQQMLNNLSDAIQFVDLENENVRKIFQRKINNYFRFRMFLKLPNLDEGTVLRMIDIYARVQPQAIDTLFNNIVETIYLNPNTRLIYLRNDMVFNFKPQQLASVIRKIEELYVSNNEIEDADKARNFSGVLEKLYSL